MMGTERSTLSRRSILFLLVLLGTPLVARSATLEDSAKELARKIAAALPVHEEIAIDVRKASTIEPGEFAAAVQNLKSELQTLGIRIAGNSGAAPTVVVTLSENVTSFVWAAEIRQGDSSRVVFQTSPQPAGNRTSPSGMPITLHSEKFWEGPQRALDAAIVSQPNGVKLLLVLTPDALVISDVGSDAVSAIPIPRTEIVSRDPTGVITQTENGVMVTIPPQICNIDTAARTLAECHPWAVDGPPTGRMFENLILLVRPGPEHVERGNQAAPIPTSCGNGLQSLASGTGDYTGPDMILLFESTVTEGVIAEKRLSDFLRFPGPVMSIQSGGAPPRAIVRNLQSSNYEAYRISISCAQ